MRLDIMTFETKLALFMSVFAFGISLYTVFSLGSRYGKGKAELTDCVFFDSQRKPVGKPVGININNTGNVQGDYRGFDSSKVKK